MCIGKCLRSCQLTVLSVVGFVFLLTVPPAHSALLCLVLYVEEEREKLRAQVVEAMSEEEIRKQAALQGTDLEKEGDKENKADKEEDKAAMETEGAENNENKVVAELRDQEPGEKKKSDESMERGEKLKDDASSKSKVVLKERELNKKVAEIAIDEQKEGEEMEEVTEGAELEGDSSTL